LDVSGTLTLSANGDSHNNKWHGIFALGGHHIDIYHNDTIQSYGSINHGTDMHLNYYSGGNITLCNGGGKVIVKDISAADNNINVSVKNLAIKSDTDPSGGNLDICGNLTTYTGKSRIVGPCYFGGAENNPIFTNGTVHIGGSLVTFSGGKKITLDSGQINLDGNLIVDGTVYAGNGETLSDDRLKHNEKNISGIDILKQIQPKKYFKTTNMFDKDHDFELDTSGNPITNEKYIEETGLIAQNILEIEELKSSVNGGDYYDANNNLISRAYSLNYNNIFVYGIQATKELINKVEMLENENQELKTKVATLETELAAIKQHLGI
jgi:hypothetical protein